MPGETLPDGAVVYDLSMDVLALLEQPEMYALRGMLSPQGARALVAHLASMERDDLIKLRAQLTPQVPTGPKG